MAPVFTQQRFREALGHFATGVTVVTTQGTEHPYGMTANAFASVSLQPPLVLVCVMNGREGSTHLRANQVFAVNVLAEHQEHLARHFADSSRPRGRAAFDRVAHARAVTGSPILEGAAAYFDCHLTAEHAAGDHVIFIGEVVELGVNSGVQPLLFHMGAYKQLPER